MAIDAVQPNHFIEPEEAESLLGLDGVVVIDLSKAETHASLHLPGARHLEYPALVAGTRPAPGLLPPIERLNGLCAALGIDPDSRVVAYDDEGGGRACRLAWTLHVMGLFSVQVINGGLHAWANEGHPVTAEPTPQHAAGSFAVSEAHGEALADRDYVLARVGDGASQLFDSRTEAEYTGARAFASRGGHIPGAILCNWTDTMDPARNMRLKSEGELRRLLEQRGFTPDREQITYCQTHHRSSHSYLMLKQLGFERVRGYAGAWAEWGNDPDLPVVTGPEPGAMNRNGASS